MTAELSPEGWASILAKIELPTMGEVPPKLEDTFDLSPQQARELVEDALEDGVLTEDTSGVFATLRVAGDVEDDVSEEEVAEVEDTGTEELEDELDEDGDTPESWAGADFANPESDVWPPSWEERRFWMARREGKKAPFAPWGDPDNPDAPCTVEEHDADWCDECDECDARYKWSITDNWAEKEVVDKWVSMVPNLGGHAALLEKEYDPYTDDPDPFVLVDGDDVRNPETGEVHPAFLELLEQLGPTYADISTSGKGIHALYRGQIPEEFRPQQAFDLDDEPWFEPAEEDDEDGDEDDDKEDPLPGVEIYDGKRVCVVTGEHVPGTPADVQEWDAEAAETILDEHVDEVDRQTVGHDTDHDGDDLELEDYEPTATTSEETTDDFRDVRAAIDRLSPHDLPLRTQQVGTDGTGWEKWDPSTYRSSSGNDSLHTPDQKAWYDQKTGRSFGVLSLFAAEQGVISKPWHDLSGADFWTTLEKAREYGAPIPVLERDGRGWDTEEGQLVVEIPAIYRRETSWGGLGAQIDEDTDAPTIDELQQATQATIGRAMHRGDSTVVDAIMGAGKTYGSFAAAKDLEEPILYTAPRKDLYGQAQEYAMDVGYDEDDILVLPVPDDCPTFLGEHGKEWKRRVWNLYELGASASTIHNLLEDELPCCPDADEHPDEPVCEYRRKNQYDPSEYEVIIGHYKHAHLDHTTFGRATVFDEDPGSTFLTELRGETLIQGVNAFLNLHHSPPIKGWDDLLQARHDPERRREALEWFETAEDGEPFDLERPDERNVIRLEEEEYHGYAPHAVYAILASEPVDDVHDLREDDDYEFELAELPGYRHKALFFASNGEFGHSKGTGYYVEIQTPPSLEHAKSVLALDGTPLLDTWTSGEDDPRPVEWEQALGRHLGYERILDDEDRAAFLRETMGHTYIQMTEHVRPYSSGRHNNKELDEELLGGISKKCLDGEPIDVTITSKKVKDEYLEDGFVERGLTDEIVHTQEVRGSNAYAECKSGAILGSTHHGDHEIARRAAWLNARVKPEYEDDDRVYGTTGDAIRDQMRELDTAQVALRIGRGRNGKGALVAINTSAYPDWLPVDGRENPGGVQMWSDCEVAIAEIVRERSESASGDDDRAVLQLEELHEAVDGDMTRRHLRRVLSRFVDRGLLHKMRDPEDERRTLVVDAGLSSYSVDSVATVTIPDIDRSTNGEACQRETGHGANKPLLGECPVNRAAGPPQSPPMPPHPVTIVVDGEGRPPPAD